MTSEEIFTLFNEISDDFRMLVIDAAAVGCFLYREGHQAAGLKLLHTAITTAGLDTEIIQWMLENTEKSFNALAMHAEVRALVINFSGEAFGKA
jgi:hypothetical protein